MLQTIPVKETRERLADLINQVDIAGRQFVITKFGKPKAMLVPVDKPQKKQTSPMESSFGAWKGRTDIVDSNTWVRALRERMSVRL